MKIYTKTGDSGTTSLFGGERVDKNSLRIEAYGGIDELNSLIGVILADDFFLSLRGALRPFGRSSTPRSLKLEELMAVSRVEPLLSGRRGNLELKDSHASLAMAGMISKKLLRIQEELFVLGGNLATPKNVKIKIPKITKSYVRRLEFEIDTWEKELTPLRNFILPGGAKTGAKLHLARAISRRVERLMVGFSRTEKIDKNLLIYINRLSDWLFTLARYFNALDGKSEIIWRGRWKIKS